MEHRESVTVREPDELPSVEIPLSGVTAHEALSSSAMTLLRVELESTAPPEWIRHPTRDAYGVVLAGELALSVGPAESPETFDATAGDCLRIASGTDYQLAVQGEDPAVVLLGLPGDGPLFERSSEPPAIEPAESPQLASPDEFVPTAKLENLTRLMPFPDAPIQQVRGHAEGNIESQRHHHGDNEIFGHILNGAGYVDDGSTEPLLATAGSFFHIPTGIVHRDVNPQADEQDYVLWLTGSEPRNVPADEPT